MTLWNNLKFFPKRSLRRKEKRFSIKKLNSKQPQSRWRKGGSSTNLLLTLSNSGANYLLNSFESRQAMTNGSGHNGSHSQGGIPNGKGMIISKMVWDEEIFWCFVQYKRQNSIDNGIFVALIFHVPQNYLRNKWSKPFAQFECHLQFMTQLKSFFYCKIVNRDICNCAPSFYHVKWWQMELGLIKMREKLGFTQFPARPQMVIFH